MGRADEGVDLDAMWTVRLSDVERLLPDDENDEGLWAIEFELNGPGVNGSLTSLLERSVSEDNIIPKARTMLLDGLKRWVEALTRGAGAERPAPPAE